MCCIGTQYSSNGDILMKFQYLEAFHKNWRDILVIGRTIERDDKRYHMVGMTLADEAKLYIIEPYSEPEHYSHRSKGVRNQRKIMKEHTGSEVCYLHCSDFYLGDQRLQVRSGSGGSLYHSIPNYEAMIVFLDMLRAGWEIPEWLKDEDWDNLQMVTLVIEDMKKLPKYSPEMPITIKHSPSFVQHMVEKTVTLNVGKSRSLRFVDSYGDEVQCYINDVKLIDVWKDTEEQFNDPRYTETVSAERLQEMKDHCFEALKQSCPKGMCYIGVEYECSKDLSLQFYSKKFLRSYPETHEGSAATFFMRLKPDQETGTHNLPLRGYVIQTAVSPDTTKIPAELLFYMEKVAEWEETV